MKGIVVPLADLIALKGEENVLDILSHFSWTVEGLEAVNMSQ
mgnify:CR=1 FL=1